MKKSLVSIVLPVYNGERFLAQAIDSIIGQSYTNWELILVNDCSTDSSLDIMKKYAGEDERIKIVDNVINLKLPKSLNAGFRTAEGEYFTWTSDDNLLKPDMLKKLVAELEEHAEYGMVYSNHDDIDENGNFLCNRTLGEPSDMGVIGNVCGASFLYRKSVADRIGEYDSDLFLAEDYDYWMRVYAKADIKHIPDVLYSCRRHGGSLTATKAEQIRHQTLRAMHKNYWELLQKCETKQMRLKLYKMILDYSDDNERHLFEKMSMELKSYIRKDNMHQFFSRIKRGMKRLVK